MEDTTSEWSARRKFLYTAVIVVILTSLSFLVFWKFWYTEPTCSDGFQNGDESGIDCGGSCSLVCRANSEAPVLRGDPRIFQVYPNIYSVLAIVDNRNIGQIAPSVKYKFSFYDKAGKVVYEREGEVSLQGNKTTAIFEGNINIKGESPVRVSFDLNKNISWIKDLREYPEITLTHSSVLNASTSPRIDATVVNKSLIEIKNLEIVATVFDGRDNAIAASRTYVNNLKKDGSTSVFFTWPKPFILDEKVCEKPSETLLLIDRSGSMASIKKNPPEPLNSVKEAAKSFVDELGEGDKVGVVSFSTLAQDPPDSFLSDNFASVRKSIDSIKILETGGTQYTNIFDALRVSLEEFDKEGENNVKRVVVVLTDGIANRPSDPKMPNSESMSTIYAEAQALLQADSLKKMGVTIYSIGLGKEVHTEFLEKLSTSKQNYFSAVQSSDLRKIYSDISFAICKEAPARIELNYKFLDFN